MITDKQKRDFADLFYRHGNHSVHESMLYEDFSNDDKFLELIYSAIEGMFDYCDEVNSFQHDKIEQMEINLEQAQRLLSSAEFAFSLLMKTRLTKEKVSRMEWEMYSGLHKGLSRYLGKVK